MSTAIEFNNISKQYRLGVVSGGTIRADFQRWWQMNIRHQEDPFLKVGETNDRACKGSSEYVWALKDIDFKVEQGDVVGIIGKNGAGKSTLLKILSKVTGPTTGTIRAKGRIGSLLEVGTGFHPEMTGRENIYLNGAILGMSKPEIKRKLDEIVDFSGCERYIDTPVKRYSSGMMVRLGFAVAAHLDPEILVVDEVLAVGDAEFQKKAIGKMQDVSREEGRTVLFVSHNMDSILSLCNKGVLLENGSVKSIGKTKEIISEYLGGGDHDFCFEQQKSQFPIYISKVCFVGDDNQRNGVFLYANDICFEINIKLNNEKRGIIEDSTVMSVILMTLNRTRICTYEINIDVLNKSSTFLFKYKGGVLVPGRYLVRVVLHKPNVCFYDRQDACVFTILDTGTSFLKYDGADNGFVMYEPQVIVK